MVAGIALALWGALVVNAGTVPGADHLMAGAVLFAVWTSDVVVTGLTIADGAAARENAGSMAGAGDSLAGIRVLHASETLGAVSGVTVAGGFATRFDAVPVPRAVHVLAWPVAVVTAAAATGKPEKYAEQDNEKFLHQMPPLIASHFLFARHFTRYSV
jgi:hypothetical protein